jgi:transcriptional regulator with XRE-family HTH domain
VRDTLARKLRVLRAERGLTLRDAEHLTGVDKDTLSKLERGLRHPHDVTLSRVAKGYGVPVDELIEEHDPGKVLARQ